MGCEPAAGGTGAADREELRSEPDGERESDWLLTSIFGYRFSPVWVPIENEFSMGALSRSGGPALLTTSRFERL
jgi:hypothetical protein